LPRDKEPSHNLHESQSMISTIDPISGKDVGNVEGKPALVDGNLTMYFKSEETRQAYLDTSKNHTLNLRDNPLEDGEAEG
jgi:YHS domain-containing protein